MFSLSRLSMLIVAFFLGFAVSAGAFLGIGYNTLNTVSLNQIEEMSGGAVDFRTEKFIGPSPEVDLSNISILALLDEVAELNVLNEKVTINFLVNRYDLILGAKFKRLLSKEAGEMPIEYLMTEAGEEKFFNTLYVGQIQGFECLGPDGESANPTDPDSYWYNPKTEQEVTGLNEILSDYTVGDILSGKVSSNSLLNDLALAEVLEYTYDEANECWLDKYGTEVTGVMAVFADCTVTTLDEKLKTVEIGELLGYKKDKESGNWLEEDGTGTMKEVHGFMNVVAGRTLENVGSIMDKLTIGDIIPEREGIMAIIPEDTKFNEIGATINTSIKTSPLQFFMNQGLINFTDKAATLDSLATKLYNANPSDYSNMLVTITSVNEGEEGYEEFKKNMDYYGNPEHGIVWTDNHDGTYTVPAWRTQPLSNSFSFIIGMFTAQSSLLPLP